MEHMATATFPLLASDNGLLHHPDTVDDVFRMCARYLSVIYANIFVSTYS